MGERTEIGWTDHTFNPWWGCARVSPACEHCYAEAFAKRTGHDVWGKHAPRRTLSDHQWREPLRWNDKAAVAGRPALVFCASMADVFEDRQDLDALRFRLFELIGATPWLRWQLLTKRIDRVAALVPAGWLSGGWPSNVWIGTTVEDQRRADERVPELLKLPAPIRFLSAEPLLEAVTLRPEWLVPPAIVCGRPSPSSAASSVAIAAVIRAAGARLGARLVDWVIVGGESGPRFRPMNPEHARALCESVRSAGVPLFFKQWGGLRPKDRGALIDLGDGPQLYQEFPNGVGR